MTALTWLALAGGVGLVPLPSAANRRAIGLARRGRLAAILPPARPARRRLRPATITLLSGMACAAAAGVLGGVALGFAAAAVAVTVAWLASCGATRRRGLRCRQGLLTALRLVVAELEAGGRPACALDAGAAVAPCHAEVLTAAASAAAAGDDVSEVLVSSGAAELQPLAHAWRLSALTGAPLADVLGRVAADLADRDRQRHAVTVALAGPRSSGALLAGLPVIGIALGAAMGARPLAFLFGAPTGRLVCCAGVLLDAAGLLWTQRLMQRAQCA
jgi:tight adherence protein B